MKKLLSLLLISATLLLLVGCFEVYKMEPQTFSADGFGITLTEGFSRSTDLAEGCYAAFESYQVLVFVTRESFDSMVGLGDLPLRDFAELSILSSGLDAAVAEIDGLVCYTLRYTDAESDVTFSYFTAFFRGTDAFWGVEFVCESADYKEFEPYFIKWAKTVSIP